LSDKSAIQWTDATWNPTTGCTKISPGCANCYIERTPAFRIAGRKFVKGWIPLQIHRDRLDQPLHWRRPRRVFVNSLSDLFHADVPDAFIDQVFGVMARVPQHTFQILTKRPDRMRAWFTRRGPVYDDASDFVALAIADGDASVIYPIEFPWPLPNVWLGVSVENQHFADERIPLLLQTPAAVRFISAEPLLGPVSLRQWFDVVSRGLPRIFPLAHTAGVSTPLLDWVIIGGESGPGARPFDLAWGRSIVAQCQAAGVPVFVKQLGAHAFEGEPENDGCGPLYGLRDRKGGDPDEWPHDLRIREFPEGRT
jgi:protein gp37